MDPNTTASSLRKIIMDTRLNYNKYILSAITQAMNTCAKETAGSIIINNKTLRDKFMSKPYSFEAGDPVVLFGEKHQTIAWDKNLPNCDIMMEHRQVDDSYYYDEQ